MTPRGRGHADFTQLSGKIQVGDSGQSDVAGCLPHLTTRMDTEAQSLGSSKQRARGPGKARSRRESGVLSPRPTLCPRKARVASAGSARGRRHVSPLPVSSAERELPT